MSLKLLFIDDEDVVLRSCRRIFAGGDYEVETARSGEEGLEKARAGDYDVVVTDLKMPGIGGIEVLKTLRKEKPDLTVIVFTGYANVETAREALKNGAFDYVPKPFTPEELTSVVRNAAEAKKASAGAKMLDLMAIVSHELKSPVSAVHTTASTLHRGYFGKLDSRQQEIVETIIKNCEYLEDIIRSYIDLSKMELDELAAFKEDIGLENDVIREIMALPEIKDNLKKMTVRLDSEPGLTVNGDPRLLKIVVQVRPGRDRDPRSIEESGRRTDFLRAQRGRRHPEGRYRKRAFPEIQPAETAGDGGRQGVRARPLYLQEDH